MRENMVNIRLTDEERERFERVAEHYGMGSIAAMLRLLVKQADDKIAKSAARVAAPTTKARGKGAKRR